MLRRKNISEWKTKGKATLIQKYLQKWTATKNYRRITSLPLMWKIPKAEIRVGIYYTLISNGLFPKEQKGCHIHLLILKESKTWRNNIAIAWTDINKAYDMVPKSLIIDCFKMFRIADKINCFWVNHEKLESEIDCKRKKFSWGENPERNLQGKYAIANICKIDDASQLHI